MKKNSAKKNYIFNVIYQISIIIIPIIVTPYISRVLMPEGVGEYAFSFSLITFFTIFAALGFGYYAQREIAKNQGEKKEQSITFWEVNICRLISVGLSLALNLILVASGVYGKYSILMLLLSINIVAIAFDISFFFQGNEEFGKLVFINLLIKVLGTIGIFVFVKNPSDVWIYAILNSIILIVSNLSLWIFLKKRLTSVKLNELKPLKHLKGTLKLFIPNIAASLYTVLDKSLIGLITHSDAENGFYEQAENIIKVVRTLVLCLGSVMIPRNSYEFAHGNVEKVKENNYKAINFVWLLGIPLMLGLILIATNFVPWFLGPNFSKSTLLIKILSCLIVIIGLSNVIGLQYLLPAKKDKQFIIAITFGAVINLILNIPLIYFYNSVGAALATIISEIVVTSSMLILVRKELSIKKILKLAIKPMIAGIIMFFAVLPLSLKLTSSVLNSMLIVSVGVIVYCLSIFILKEKLTLSLLKEIKLKLNSMFKKDKNNKN